MYLKTHDEAFLGSVVALTPTSGLYSFNLVQLSVVNQFVVNLLCNK